MRRAGWGLVLAAGCGSLELPGPFESPDTDGPPVATSGGSDDAADETTDDPIADVPSEPPLDDTLVCGQIAPADCTLAPPLAIGVIDSTEIYFVTVTAGSVFIAGFNAGDDAPVPGWQRFNFSVPCPADDAPLEPGTRVQVEGELEVITTESDDTSLVPRYTARFDLELINACPHLVIHGVDVDPTPLNVPEPTFDFPEVLPTGPIRAVLNPTD